MAEKQKDGHDMYFRIDIKPCLLYIVNTRLTGSLYPIYIKSYTTHTNFIPVVNTGSLITVQDEKSREDANALVACKETAEQKPHVTVGTLVHARE